MTGLGFLGAGAIIRQGLSVRGLTTAASLWIVAAIGMAVGAGYWRAAIIATALVLFALWPLRLVVYPLLLRLRPDEALLVELRAGEAAATLIDALEQIGGQVHSIEFEQAAAQRRCSTSSVDLPAGTRDAASPSSPRSST